MTFLMYYCSVSCDFSIIIIFLIYFFKIFILVSSFFFLNDVTCVNDIRTLTCMHVSSDTCT